MADPKDHLMLAIAQRAKAEIARLEDSALELHQAGCDESERATENQKEITRLRVLLRTNSSF